MSTVAYVSRGSYVPVADTCETTVYLHRDNVKTEKRSKDTFRTWILASCISSTPREKEHLEYVSALDSTNNFDKKILVAAPLIHARPFATTQLPFLIARISAERVGERHNDSACAHDTRSIHRR